MARKNVYGFFFSVHIIKENKLRHKAQSQYITDKKKKHIYFCC